MLVGERKMRRQKSSPGEHLQSAIPMRSAHTLAPSHRSERSNHSPFDPDSEKEEEEDEERHKEAQRGKEQSADTSD